MMRGAVTVTHLSMLASVPFTTSSSADATVTRIARRLFPHGASRRELRTFALLVLATIPFAYVNTLFTQTVSYAADEFGASDAAIGLGAAIVRWGVVLAIPIAWAADRFGRRLVLVTLAWLAPLSAALGALAPSFTWLVASQTLARPLAVSINVLVGVIAAEEMSRESRASTLGLLGIAAGFGAGLAVAALPLADVAVGGWRWVYVIALVWCGVGVVLTRGLTETRRFVTQHAQRRRALRQQLLDPRLLMQLVAALLANVFIATASVFQVNYLRDVRDYSPLLVTIFTFVTATPAAIGLVIGGRLADQRGRRVLAAVTLLIGTWMLTASFAVSGPAMWASALLGGIGFGMAYPAFGVYRGELFPTTDRSFSSGMITAASLIGGSIGLIVAGTSLDASRSYGEILALFAVGPTLVSLFVVRTFPETAHRELEEISNQTGR